MEIASETQGKTKDSDVTGQSLQKPEKYMKENAQKMSIKQLEGTLMGRHNMQDLQGGPTMAEPCLPPQRNLSGKRDLGKE